MKLIQRDFIAPLDGQTNFPTDLPIRVVSSLIDIPDGYPIPELIQVTNADNGLPVPGNITIDSTGLTFTPNNDWRPNRRYVWNIEAPRAVPHGPELVFPDNLLGAAVFDTTPRLKMLIGGVDADSRTCAVFSRPVNNETDAGTLRVTVNDIEIEDAVFSELAPGEIGPGYPLDPSDPGVSVVCMTTSSPITAGASFRLWWGSNGPWRVDLLDATPDELIEILRRGNQ
jgi:hypothetical protein